MVNALARRRLDEARLTNAERMEARACAGACASRGPPGLGTGTGTGTGTSSLPSPVPSRTRKGRAGTEMGTG